MLPLQDGCWECIRKLDTQRPGKDESNDDEARNMSIANLRLKAEAHSKNLENEKTSEDSKMQSDDVSS